MKPRYTCKCPPFPWILPVLLLIFSAQAQLTPPQKLSVEDEREFRKELDRLNTLLPTVDNKPAIELQIANTYAAGGQFSEAVERLRRIVEANLGFDPAGDTDFAKIRNTKEFLSILNKVRHQTPLVHNSRLIAILNERDIRPESIAFDSKRNAFLLGNTTKFELVRCSLNGDCHSFVMPSAGEESYVLGVKIDSARDAVWATRNTSSTASLRSYDLETGALRRTASIAGKHCSTTLLSLRQEQFM